MFFFPRRNNFFFLSYLISVFLYFQVLRLTQKEQALEERLEGVCQENTELRSSLASLHTRLALHDQLNQQHSQQVQIQTRQHKAAQCGRCMNERALNNKGIFCSRPGGLGFGGIVESIAKQSPHPRHCNFHS